MDGIEELLGLGPEAQSESEEAERQRLARLPAHERLRQVMEQVRFHQEMQARTLTPRQRASRREREVAEARRTWGDALP
jgi:signal transduction histidine kinase